MTAATRRFHFVACVENEGYEVSLEPGKLYRPLRDAAGTRRGLVRVVDESGEDYLYPRTCFVPVEVSAEASRLLEKIGRLQRRK